MDGNYFIKLQKASRRILAEIGVLKEINFELERVATELEEENEKLKTDKEELTYNVLGLEIIISDLKKEIGRT